ncbi:pancreatic triacylglycerol lipase-like [Adelges cooleyi]|uniref:pancreatic triacylglycerol lipase-like n=1 Tax=Adelges cooleyi TaxID=133065 RepID=UPI00217F97DF|nr:pancreatic triacylglycerol lipase-like [Adelges cooleyi]
MAFMVFFFGYVYILMSPIFASVAMFNPICLLNPTKIDGMEFYLYTKDAVTRIAVDERTVKRAPFASSKEIVIFIHGYTAHYDDRFSSVIPKAYLNGTEDRNVIMVDYSRVTGDVPQSNFGSTAIWAMLYAKSVYCDLPLIAEEIANLVELIRNERPGIVNVHVIGHSLGGQIAGQVGVIYRQSTGRLLDRVTALDPAGPLFEEKAIVSPRVAKFVDVVHTGVAVLGYVEPIGTVDFYMNNGVIQTGCLNYGRETWVQEQKDTVGCSHLAAILYYADSINNNKIIGKSCNEIEQLVKNKINLLPVDNDNNNAISKLCSSQVKSEGNSVVFGEHVSLESVGIYYVTIRNVPFSELLNNF